MSYFENLTQIIYGRVARTGVHQATIPQPNTWSPPCTQNPIYERFHEHRVYKTFSKREKILQRLHPSDAQSCPIPWTRLIDQVYTLERSRTFPTIHDQVFLRTRPWRSFSLVAPLPSGSARAKSSSKWRYPGEVSH